MTHFDQWTPSEIESLRKFIDQGLKPIEIAIKLKRSESAIKTKAARIGKKFGVIYQAWKSDDIEYLKKQAEVGNTASEVAKNLNTTKNAILGKARRLGIKFGRTTGPNQPVFKKKTVVPVGPTVKVYFTQPVVKRTVCNRGVTLLSVVKGQCRWPIFGSGANFCMCGEESGEKVYCDAHSRQAYHKMHQ